MFTFIKTEYKTPISLAASRGFLPRSRDLEDAMKQAAKKVNKNRKEDYKVTFS